MALPLLDVSLFSTNFRKCFQKIFHTKLYKTRCASFYPFSKQNQETGEPNRLNFQEMRKRNTIKHTHEEFKPITIFYSILELFNLWIIKNQLTNDCPFHISWKKKNKWWFIYWRLFYKIIRIKEAYILWNLISIWLSMSSFPPKTSPRPPHLCAGLFDGWQNGRLK